MSKRIKKDRSDWWNPTFWLGDKTKLQDLVEFQNSLIFKELSSRVKKHKWQLAIVRRQENVFTVELEGQEILNIRLNEDQVGQPGWKTKAYIKMPEENRFFVDDVDIGPEVKE